jgi:hypothetical protein
MAMRVLIVIAASLVLLVRDVRPQGVSSEIEALLASTPSDRPLSVTEKDALVRQLRRRGIETLTDLHPYLARSETVRGSALVAIEHIGGVDPPTVRRIRQLVASTGTTPDPSVATAVRIVLEGSARDVAVGFANDVAPIVQLAPLSEIAWWLVRQDRAWLADAAPAHEVAAGCLERLPALFGTGTYAGRWPMRFALVAQRLPFDAPAHTAAVIRAFLTAVENAGRTTDLRELAFIGSFAAVARLAERAPEDVERGLAGIVTTGALPLTRLVLWRMHTDGLATTAAGARVIGLAIARFPDLRSFVARLADPAASGGEARGAPAAEIAAALAALPAPLSGP